MNQQDLQAAVQSARIFDLEDTLQRIATEYPSIFEESPCGCRSEWGEACQRCEILHLLKEWLPDDYVQPLPSMARKAIPDAAICFFMDGDMWACVRGDFDNLQDSHAGFGGTRDQAYADLLKNETALTP